MPGLTTPGYALATLAPLPPPGPLPLTPAVAGVAGVPANPYAIYRLDSGDRVRVIVFGQDNLSRVYSVDPSGSVSLPLIGPIRARGLTAFQLSTDIAAELRRKYIKDLKVSVEVETYRPFFILGEVTRPGQYVNAMTVEAAVAIAEGYTERAKKRMVRLTRRFGGVNSTVMVPGRLSGATRRHYLRSRTLLLKLTQPSGRGPERGVQ
jgi:polysaccharide export outer membrane protein